MNEFLRSKHLLDMWKWDNWRYHAGAACFVLNVVSLPEISVFISPTSSINDVRYCLSDLIRFISWILNAQWILLCKSQLGYNRIILTDGTRETVEAPQPLLVPLMWCEIRLTEKCLYLCLLCFIKASLLQKTLKYSFACRFIVTNYFYRFTDVLIWTEDL